jgi:hypothetical protein
VHDLTNILRRIDEGVYESPLAWGIMVGKLTEDAVEDDGTAEEDDHDGGATGNGSER